MILDRLNDTIYGEKVLLTSRDIKSGRLIILEGTIFRIYKTKQSADCTIKKVAREVEKVKIIGLGLSSNGGRFSLNQEDMVCSPILELYVEGNNDISKGVFEKKRFKISHGTSDHSRLGLNLENTFARVTIEPRAVLKRESNIIHTAKLN